MFAVIALLPLLASVSASPVKRATNQLIYATNKGQCISPVPGVQWIDGTAVVSVDCSRASTWDIDFGSGSIILSGSNFALDAGTNPGNGGKLKIWQSYPGLYQQTWYYTNDHRIAITGGNQCLDNDVNTGIQTWQCTTRNPNQDFDTKTGGGPPPSSSSSAPTSSSSAPPTPTGVLPNVPSGTVYYDLPGQGQRLRPFGRNDLCVSVIGDQFVNGAQVAITYCPNNDSPYVSQSVWDFPSSSNGNKFRLHNHKDFCLDAGINPQNGVQMKIWQCYDNTPQQAWPQINNTLLYQTQNNQCLDIELGSQPVNTSPVKTQGNLQVWQCSAQDPQQQFNPLYHP